MAVVEPPASSAATAARPADAGPGGVGARAAEPSLLGAAQAVLRELPGLVSDRVHLVALELKRAGLALAQVVALAVVAAILLLTAWFALWVGLAGWALRAGVPWGWVIVGVLVLNVGAAAVALLRARALARLLTLPATLRRLTVTPAAEPPPRSPERSVSDALS